MKVTSLGSERDALAASLSERKEAEAQLTEELRTAQEHNQVEVGSLLDKLDGKTKAGWCCSDGILLIFSVGAFFLL